jgi:hypothetical protein
MKHISAQEYLETSSETKDQIALVQYLRQIKYDGHPLRFAAIPNGGKRNKREAAILKMMGVSPGLMDILIFDTPPNYPETKGAAIEMKRLSGGVVSDDQKEWLNYFNNNGWMARVARGINEAIKILRQYGYIR